MGIGFYARNPVVLPHSDYPKATIYVIEAAISEAWRIIRDSPQGDFKITEADEDSITRELRTCLMNMVLDGGQVPGFTSDLFYITREAKFESYDGTHLDKMPDIHIHIVRSSPVSIPSADGLFVECKPVDRDHPAGSTYCDKGIIRFVNGDYAWASIRALMVGYASPGYTMPQTLTTSLRDRKKVLGVTGKVMACKDCKPKGYGQQPHITIHRRGFVYPLTKTKPPAIILRHIWLNKQ
ncbi:MAG: hypothetical protein ACLQU5_19370 [Isosphaeraceae bacterium]